MVKYTLRRQSGQRRAGAPGDSPPSETPGAAAVGLWVKGSLGLCLLALLDGWGGVLATRAQTIELREPRRSSNGTFEVIAASPEPSGYFILWRGADPNSIVTPASAALPRMPTVLTDDGALLSAQGFYRVEWVAPESPRDLDGDGLTDVFELTYAPAFDPLHSVDAAGDFDGDGFDNFEEQGRGTDPTDPGDRPLLRIGTAPAAGETGVSVHREVTVIFEKPLAAAAELSGERFCLEFGGRRILARTELSADRSRAWLFPLEPLPAGSRIQAVFDGAGMLDGLGREVDADGDGQPGGRWRFDYTTFGATPVPGTAVIGSVFDSEPQPDGTGGFTNRPLAGVIVTVDGAEETLRATTDAAGFFRLEPAPAGRFFVQVDGRNAAGSLWPGGSYYPFIGKAWEAVPGRTDNLAGGTGQIFLPKIVGGTLQSVSATADTEITFPPEVLAARPELNGVSIRVPANALFAENGTRGGRVGIAPVPPDRLPEPLPAGLALPLVITIQTDGPLNFDRPVPVRFPNLPDPLTGVTLPPGANTLLWSFDHDVGRWEIQGTMTISADGRFAESDPGVGVRQPGWHGTSPGCVPGPFGFRRSNACTGAVWSGLTACILSFAPIPGAAIRQCLALNLGGGLIQASGDCWDFGSQQSSDLDWCGISLLSVFLTSAPCLLTPIPVYGQLISCGLGGISIARNCFPSSLTLAAASLARQRGPEEHASEKVWRVYEAHLQILEGLAEMLRLATGSRVWVESVNPEDVDALEQQRMVIGLLRRWVAYTAPSSPGGVGLSAEELDDWKGAPRPSRFPTAAFDQMADYHNRTVALHQQGTTTHAAAGRSDFMDRDQMAAAIGRVSDLLAELRGLGMSHVSLPEAHQAFLDEVARLGGTEPITDRDRIFFRLELLYADAELLTRTPLVQGPLHGRMLSDGRLPFAALAPKAIYRAEFFDPTRNLYGKVQFHTGPAGGTMEMPTVELAALDGPPDQDGDGLPDLGEWVIGFLDPSNPDTDGQHGTDREDVIAALMSGVGAPVGRGMVAVLDTAGEAVDLAAHERYTVVADSAGGLVVVEVDGLNLTRAAVIPTPGIARAVAVDGDWAVGGDSLGALTVLDLSRPAAEFATPHAQLPVGAPIWGVAVADPVAFVALDHGQLLAVHLALGLVLDRVTVSTQKLDDVVVAGGRVAVLAGARLHLFDWDGVFLRSLGDAPNLGYNPSIFFAGRHRLFTDGGRVFATHPQGFNVFDITGSGPVLVRSVPTGQRDWKHLIALDNARGIAAVGLNTGLDPADDNVSLYDLGAPPGSDGFLALFGTPGSARAVLSRQGYLQVADHRAGLQVVNLLAPDRAGLAPAVTIRLASGTTTVETDRWVELVADAVDDVALRQVEFLVSGSVVYTDPSFPFRHRLRAPAAGAPFVVAAQAADTAGNTTLSAPLALTVLPDGTAPQLLQTLPAFGATVGALHEIVALFSERLHAATVASHSVVVRAAGPDDRFDTADDTTPAAATQTLRHLQEALVVSLAAPLPPGRYRIEVSPALTDLAGLPVTNLFAPVFRVAGPPDMTDTDRDGLPDVWEAAVSATDSAQVDTNGNGTPDGLEDPDGDGLSTLFELIAGTDPTKADTFQTGRGDAEFDADGDALTLRQEMLLGTDPTLPDTDGDGWNDEAEMTLRSRPNDPRSRPWVFSLAPARPGIARPAWERGAGLYGAPQSVGLARPALEAGGGTDYGTTVGQPPLALQRHEP